MQRARTKASSGILTVQILEAKPNPMFTEEQRAMVRFLRYNQTVPCAECQKKRRLLWTMLCSFRACNMDRGFALEHSTSQTHAPLTPVCGDHPLIPARWSVEIPRKARNTRTL